MKQVIRRNFFATAILGFSALCATLPAAAQEPAGNAALYDTNSVTVRFADLNLASSAGVQTLYQRLETAARRVCGSPDSRDFEARRDWKRCYSSALNSAVSTIGNGSLSELHAEKNGRPVTSQSLIASEP
jgi:UrcA family protein